MLLVSIIKLVDIIEYIKHKNQTTMEIKTKWYKETVYTYQKWQGNLKAFKPYQPTQQQTIIAKNKML